MLIIVDLYCIMLILSNTLAEVFRNNLSRAVQYYSCNETLEVSNARRLK